MTGSIYKDTVFDGSKLCPARGNVFIVKTHRTDNSLQNHPDCIKIGKTKLNFSSAIYILRNPYNAILAEFNRQHKKRTKPDKRTSAVEMGIATKECFNKTSKLKI